MVRHRNQLRPCPDYPFLFENGYFFLWYAYSVKMVTENTSFQKRSPERRLLKLPAFYLCVEGWKQRFLNTIISYIKNASLKYIITWQMLNKGCFVSRGENYSNTLLCVDAQLFWKQRKISVFKNIQIHVDRA